MKNPLKVICLASFLLVGLSSVLHGESPATTQAAGDQGIEVKKGTLKLQMSGEGIFVPVEPFELKLKPKVYQGDTTITFIAPAGATVKAGDKLLEIDVAEINKQLAAARNELKLAKANLEKAEADQKLGQEADELSLRQAQKELTNAQSGLKWWDEVDGRQMLQQADLQVKQVSDSVGDQQDELDQLKKMYKSEDLTSATADIVVKRAVRQLEQTKIQLTMIESRADKTKKFEFPISRDNVAVNVDRARQSLEQLMAAQKQSKVAREAALFTAKAASESSEKKLGDLQSDARQLSIVSPIDGQIYYGQMVNGAWQNDDPKLLRKDEKAVLQQVLMTVAPTNSWRVRLEVPEAKRSLVDPSAKVLVTPIAQPHKRFEGKIIRIGKIAGGHCDVEIDVTLADPRITPGMKAAVSIDRGEAKDVLIIPLAAVQHGRVMVKGEARDVALGRSDGENIEVLNGLSEGEFVTPAGKK